MGSRRLFTFVCFVLTFFFYKCVPEFPSMALSSQRTMTTTTARSAAAVGNRRTRTVGVVSIDTVPGHARRRPIPVLLAREKKNDPPWSKHDIDIRHTVRRRVPVCLSSGKQRGTEKERRRRCSSSHN
mmetsp:Transcript_1077/g.2472  ORF Transcript_1077/g.2472 Transcript_1077/m.2472 type:complete len:127 (+) Transcript_1077:209-589(+)